MTSQVVYCSAPPSSSVFGEMYIEEVWTTSRPATPRPYEEILPDTDEEPDEEELDEMGRELLIANEQEDALLDHVGRQLLGLNTPAGPIAGSPSKVVRLPVLDLLPSIPFDALLGGSWFGSGTMGFGPTFASPTGVWISDVRDEDSEDFFSYRDAALTVDRPNLLEFSDADEEAQDMMARSRASTPSPPTFVPAPGGVGVVRPSTSVPITTISTSIPITTISTSIPITTTSETYTTEGGGGEPSGRQGHARTVSIEDVPDEDELAGLSSSARNAGGTTAAGSDEAAGERPPRKTAKVETESAEGTPEITRFSSTEGEADEEEDREMVIRIPIGGGDSPR